MEDTTVAPALTPSEWRGLQCSRPHVVMMARDGEDVANGHGCIDIGETAWGQDGEVMVGPEARHALAALALHGQPFGFTRDDVRELLVVADHDEAFAPGDGYVSHYRDLAARIAALLPPEP